MLDFLLSPNGFFPLDVDNETQKRLLEVIEHIGECVLTEEVPCPFPGCQEVFTLIGMDTFFSHCGGHRPSSTPSLVGNGFEDLKGLESGTEDTCDSEAYASTLIGSDATLKPSDQYLPPDEYGPLSPLTPVSTIEKELEETEAAQKKAARKKAALRKAAREKAARARAAQEKAAQQKAARRKAAQEKAAQEKAEAARLEKIQEEQERIALAEYLAEYLAERYEDDRIWVAEMDERDERMREELGWDGRYAVSCLRSTS